MKNWIFLNVTNHEKELPYYIYGAGSFYDQDPVFRPQGCPWFQLNICYSGRGILKMNGVETPITAGDSLIIYPDIPHEYHAVKGKMIVSWIAFDGFQVSSMLKSIGAGISGIYRLGNTDDIHKSIGAALAIQNMELTEQGYSGSRMVYDFLLTVMRNFPAENRSGQNDYTVEKLKPALAYMNDHLSEQIGIEEIAGSMSVTPQHFCLIFKTAMRQRPFEYLNSLRINRAKNLLINSPALPLSEISRLSGYPNHSYFCLLFKKQERLTPAEFRKLYRQDSVPVRLDV